MSGFKIVAMTGFSECNLEKCIIPLPTFDGQLRAGDFPKTAPTDCRAWQTGGDQDRPNLPARISYGIPVLRRKEGGTIMIPADEPLTSTARPDERRLAFLSPLERYHRWRPPLGVRVIKGVSPARR